MQIRSKGKRTLRYDISFSWVHYSDCGRPCDEQKYRFHAKGFRLIKESGWLWTEPKDPVDRFTISHSLYYPFYDGDTAKNITRHNHLKEQIISDPKNPRIIADTIQRINDRYFSIITMEKSDTVLVRKVLAVTMINNNMCPVVSILYKMLPAAD